MKHKMLEHLFEIIAHEATFGIVVFQSDGACLFSNRMAQGLLNLETPSLQAMVPQVDKPPFKSFSCETLKHEGLYQDVLVSQEGQGTFVANIGVKHVHFDGVDAHLLMMQDVTVQKKLQREIIHKQIEVKAAYEELLKQNRQLKELDAAKNKFIALTTHELRTPLSAMVASAEILKLGLYDTPEQMKEFIDMIYDQGQHLQTLVNDILDFAKIQAGKMDFHLELQDIVAVTKSVMTGFTSMAEANGITISAAAPTGKMECYFDELRLRQVLSNMISNAMKYNRPGGRVGLFFAESEDWVRVLVEDTGKGIPDDQFEKVFNEFETVGQMAEHHKGTGLGMPISRKLTEGMGGLLNFTSTVDIGTTFWIELPKKKIMPEALYGARVA